MEIPDLVSVGGVTAILAHHVYTLRKGVHDKMIFAKSLALFFCSILLIALLINNYIVNFFVYSFYMLLMTFIPTIIYSVFLTLEKK